MTLVKPSPCKVNLLLNILGPRPDGFHELETVLQPLPLFDEVRLTVEGNGIVLKCNDPSLPLDSGNLAVRAAEQFLKATSIKRGVKIDLEKRIPLAAGLGGGSGNAATVLLALNELFDQPLAPPQLTSLAAGLGSDVPFFLQSKPALATGRGEQIRSLNPFAALTGAGFLLVHPGFGIATAWAYQQLQQFPEALHGKPGRAQRLISALEQPNLGIASGEFYNSLEAPALRKYPLLTLFQEFFRENGASATLMSGSGSTTFAIAPSVDEARKLEQRFLKQFGAVYWTRVVPAAGRTSD